jgi:hypothetical protein
VPALRDVAQQPADERRGTLLRESAHDDVPLALRAVERELELGERLPHDRHELRAQQWLIALRNEHAQRLTLERPSGATQEL